MSKSRNAASVLAGVLGGLALLGAVAGPASGAEDPNGCVSDGRGGVSCVQMSEERLTIDRDGTVHHTVKGSKPACSAGAGEISCETSAVTKPIR
ncbi:MULTISPECIES: hypothetical protein [Streptomyces]|uniref:Uncharacterized protein n=1 Tax=Streptomyces tendae TaxID=1932 RepID=A0ABX5ZZM5_STRTE|nr:hypothetical protein [Streptomyces tendae]QER89001.1 hypothetical protein F3L20_26865 [Streptomyces tendae]